MELPTKPFRSSYQIVKRYRSRRTGNLQEGTTGIIGTYEEALMTFDGTVAQMYRFPNIRTLTLIDLANNRIIREWVRHGESDYLERERAA